MKRQHRLIASGLAFLLGITLVACDAEAREGAVAGGSAGSTSDASTKSPESTKTEAPEPEVKPEDCLTGTWLADNEFFLEGMREYGDETQSVTGDVFVTYGDDGTLTTDYQGWLITFLTEGIPGTISRDGVDTGTFTATADTVTIRDTSMGSAMLVTAGGMAMPVEPTPISYENVPYTCSATNASLTTIDGEMRMTRR